MKNYRPFLQISDCPVLRTGVSSTSLFLSTTYKCHQYISFEPFYLKNILIPTLSLDIIHKYLTSTTTVFKTLKQEREN